MHENGNMDWSDPRGEHELRQRYMSRIRRDLGFSGVHLHYSTISEKPSSRKARRQSTTQGYRQIRSR